MLSEWGLWVLSYVLVLQQVSRYAHDQPSKPIARKGDEQSLIP